MKLTGVSYDSRTTCSGDVFFAVKGFMSDGHKYIPTAAARGASLVICEDTPVCDIPYVRVANCRRALAVFSALFFDEPAKKMKVIGITGTNGKTTTSYLIKHILEQDSSCKVGLVGTNGNMIGSKLLHTERTTPESFELQKLFSEMVSEGCTHVVMEVSSHSLVLDRVYGIRFAATVFTNLTQDHLDFHGTMENYADAKAILFSMSDASVINLDDSWSDFFVNAAPKQNFTGFSIMKKAELHASDVNARADGVSFRLECGSEQYDARLAIPGMFSVYNAMGAIGACMAVGISAKQCVDGLGSAEGVKGRVEVVPTDRPYTVLIDYAHTPDALENVLKTLRPLTAGRLICIFGCGGDRDSKKRPIMGRIASANSDLCIVTSDNPRTEDPDAIIADILPGIVPECKELKVVTDRISAIHYALDVGREGDVILLAGKGHEDYQEINHVKHHMDEREIVRDHLNN